MPRVGWIGFGARFDLFGGGFVGDADVAREAVQFEDGGALAGGVGLVEIEQAGEKCLAGFEADGDFLLVPQTVEISRGREDADVTVGLAEFSKVREHLGIHQVAIEVVVAGFFGTDGLGHFMTGFLKVHFFSAFSGAVGERFLFAENNFLDIGRPAAHGLAETALEHIDHAFGETGAGGQGIEITAGIAGFNAA